VENRAVVGQRLFFLERELLSNTIELETMLETDVHLMIETVRIEKKTTGPN
jgi:hypothetical protein